MKFTRWVFLTLFFSCLRLVSHDLAHCVLRRYRGQVPVAEEFLSDLLCNSILRKL